MIYAIVFFLILVGAGVVYFYAAPNATTSESQIEKINGGWVIRCARETDHFCNPPDSYGRTFRYGGHKPESISLTNIKNRWSLGDMWLCSCGRAWVVGEPWPNTTIIEWQRSEKDDVAVINP